MLKIFVLVITLLLVVSPFVLVYAFAVFLGKKTEKRREELLDKQINDFRFVTGKCSGLICSLSKIPYEWRMQW